MGPCELGGGAGDRGERREVVVRSYLRKCDSADPVTGTSINTASVCW